MHLQSTRSPFRRRFTCWRLTARLRRFHHCGSQSADGCGVTRGTRKLGAGLKTRDGRPSPDRSHSARILYAWRGLVVRHDAWRSVLADAYAATQATFVVDDLAAAGGAHPGPKAELAFAFDSADAMWVMHGIVPLVIQPSTDGRETSFHKLPSRVVCAGDGLASRTPHGRCKRNHRRKSGAPPASREAGSDEVCGSGPASQVRITRFSRRAVDVS